LFTAPARFTVRSSGNPDAGIDLANDERAINARLMSPKSRAFLMTELSISASALSLSLLAPRREASRRSRDVSSLITLRLMNYSGFIHLSVDVVAPRAKPSRRAA